MLKLKKRTKTKPKLKPTPTFKNYSYECAYHCAQLSYTTQHRTVLIIFPLILQTIIAQMMSTGWEKDHKNFVVWMADRNSSSQNVCGAPITSQTLMHFQITITDYNSNHISCSN